MSLLDPKRTAAFLMGQTPSAMELPRPDCGRSSLHV